MEDGEDGHLNVQEHGWYPNLDVWCLNLIAWLDGPGSCKQRYGKCLPEAEKDDQFDSCDLQQRFVLSDVVLQLYVELDDTEHGDRDCSCLNSHHPNMREDWI